MDVFEEISECVRRGLVGQTESAVAAALRVGTPEAVLQRVIGGMDEAGERFERGDALVSEVLLSAAAANAALALLRPALGAGGASKGKAILCSVQGDLHDVGKNLVRILLEASGIEAIDLGVDCPPQAVADAIRDTGARAVCLSAHLSAALPALKETIGAIEAAGLKPRVKILAGGQAVTEALAKAAGADAYAPEAYQAVRLVRSFFG